jgi:hypothetical protein
MYIISMKEDFFQSHDRKELRRIAEETDKKLDRDFIVDMISAFIFLFLLPIIFYLLKGVYSLLH